MNRLVTVIIYGLSGLIGLAAFLYPLLLPQLAAGATGEVDALRTAEAPLLTLLLLLLCLVVLLLEVQGQVINAKVVAALGVLVALTAALRFLEVAMPGPGGFSPFFAPIILAGYVFGARFGFLLGTLAMLVSAVVTGGVGPWLPYQMFAAGWVGLTAGWLPQINRLHWAVAMLAATGFIWGLLFGVIMNLFFWPFIAGEQALLAGDGLAASVSRYLAFYLTTSFWWDLVRSIGNVLLLVAIGGPAVKALTRFRRRLQFQWVA